MSINTWPLSQQCSDCKFSVFIMDTERFGSSAYACDKLINLNWDKIGCDKRVEMNDDDYKERNIVIDKEILKNLKGEK